MKSYDLIVIGGGSAGLAVAGRVKDAGRSVLVVEARDFGGTCPLRGCVPKKVLVAAAETLHHIAAAGAHGIEVGPPRVDWPKLIARKETFVEGVPESFERGLVKRGVEVVYGRAKFAGPHEIEVDGERYRGAKFVISTGSKPRRLPIPGFDHTITSEDLLEMPALPASLIFIGAGVIAMEFTHVLARAGTKVTLVEIAPRPLPMLDADLVEALVEETRRLGVDVYTAAETRSIEKEGETCVVTFVHEGRTKTLRAERVANGAGRGAAVDDLGLDAAGIAHERGAITVDAYLRSVSNPDVFVAGDTLAGRPQLSPVAGYEGKIVAHNLLNDALKAPDYTSIPQVVFTVPALASVGMDERAAEAQGLAFDVKVNDMRTWRSARTYAETAALAKVLVERGTGRILGAKLLGHGAQEVIHTFAFALKYGIHADELKDFVYAYPTFTSDVKYLV